jgi:hypothetical protein
MPPSRLESYGFECENPGRETAPPQHPESSEGRRCVRQRAGGIRREGGGWVAHHAGDALIGADYANSEFRTVAP